MSGLLATRSTRRRGIAYGALLGVSVFLMLISGTATAGELQRGVSFAFRPLQEALTGVARSASSLVGAVTEIDRLRGQNEALARENQRLGNENTQLQEIKRENEQLTALLQIRGSLGYATVAAQVISRDASEFRRDVTIDVGTDRGVKEGDVVVAAGGALAGRVVQAGPDFAKVLLINDTSSTVTGQVQPTAATGEVIGQLGGALVMQDIDSTEKLQLGQQVVTAGIELRGGIRSPFPKGLIIGQIVDVQRDANAVVQTAFLRPTVDLDKLEYVLVVTNYQGGLPALGQSPSASLDTNGTLPNNEQPYVSPRPSIKPGTSRAPGPASPPAPTR
ncbi:MAG: rod shape-determining protein MreC [Candidatus Limnocylindrales bacterium]